MELPEPLRAAIEDIASAVDRGQLTQLSRELSSRYRNHSGGEKLLSAEAEAAAYCAARMPATYGAVYSSLLKSLELCGEIPRTVLDVGAGTGAAAWAAEEILVPQSIICLEREAAMINTGKLLMRSSKILADKTLWQSFDLTLGSIDHRADLVIASYALNELRESERDEALGRLWNAAEMLLLIIEPGTPGGYRQIMKTRDTLLSLGAHIAAPCPHAYGCRLPENDWCAFKCRIARSRLHKQLKGGEAPYEDEKFIYLAAVRKEVRHAPARILRHPETAKGRVTLTLCTEEKIGRVTITKKDGDLYRRAKKAECGDAFSLATAHNTLEDNGASGE